MTIMLQRAITPGLAQAYLEHGFDRVSGWVVDASDVGSLTTANELRALHHLDFPGTPFDTDGPIHILHFPAPQATPLVRANPTAMSELFPLAEGGVVRVGELSTPLLWLEHTRLTDGARLWRFIPGQDTPTLAGTYHGPAFGWLTEDETFHAVPPTIMAGRVAVLNGAAYAAEPEYDADGQVSTVTLATVNPPPENDFTQTEAGIWAKAVAFSDLEVLFESHVKANVAGLPVRVVERFTAPEGDLARISSLVLDHGANQAAGFELIEPGVWEATVPWAKLSDFEPTQRVARAWASAQTLAESLPVSAQVEAEASASAARPEVTLANTDPDDPMATPELQQIYRAIIAKISEVAPREAERIEIMCSCVDAHFQFATQVIFGEDEVRALPEIGPDLAPILAQLRHETALPGEGAWFSIFLAITQTGDFHLSFDYKTEPQLAADFPPAAWAAELARYPRTDEHIPDWLLARLDQPGE